MSLKLNGKKFPFLKTLQLYIVFLKNKTSSFSYKVLTTRTAQPSIKGWVKFKK